MSKSHLLNQRKYPSQHRHQLKLKLLIASLVLLLPLGWVGYRQISSYFAQPEAVLVLGGATEREDFAASFARQHPELPVWVSGGSNPEYTQAVFSDAGIPHDRLHIDRVAVDTVTNFTSLVDTLQQRNIKSIYLITSDYHMRRAQIIGEIVLGSRGIVIKPVSVPSRKASEPFSKSMRDGIRAVVWLATGHTGSTLMQRFGHR